MEKININGKEIEFDEKDLKPLSDEILEAVTGGFKIPEDGTIILYRYECFSCSARGPLFTIDEKYNPEVRKINHRYPDCKGYFGCCECYCYLLEE